MGRDYMILHVASHRSDLLRTIKKGRWTTSKDICVWILLPVEIRICHVQTSWISHPLNHMALMKQERKQLGTTCNLGWPCLTIQEPHFVASISWHIDAGMFAEPVAWFTRPSRQLHRSAFSKVRSMDVSPMIHLGNPRGPPRDATHYWKQHAWWVKKIEHEQSPSHNSWDSSDFFGKPKTPPWLKLGRCWVKELILIYIVWHHMLNWTTHSFVTLDFFDVPLFSV